MNQIKTLQDFMINYVEYLDGDSGSGTNLFYPSYEIYPRDFLKFAEIELLQINKKDSSETIHTINCISHLKRAMDCQLDTFFYVLRIKNNLRVDKKLDFLKSAGIFSSSSLSRLNSIRNKIEHEYTIPKLYELEVYFDLVTAFVSILETAIIQLTNFSEVFLTSRNYHNLKEYNELNFNIKYFIKEKPKIVVEINYYKDDFKRTEELISTPTDYVEFAYFLKILFLSGKIYGIPNLNHIKELLKFEQKL